MQFMEIGKTLICRFDSCNDAVQSILQMKYKDRYLKVVDRDRIAFVGRKFESIDDWKEYILSGDENILDFMSKMKSNIKSQIETPKVIRRRRMRFDESEGEEVIMENLYSGNPYWISMLGEMALNKRRVISLIIPVQMNYTQNFNLVSLQSAGAILLTELLEKSGYSVELWLMAYSTKVYYKGDKEDSIAAIKLKDSKRPLNIQSISSICSGTFFRTGILTIWSSGNGVERDPRLHCGYSIKPNKENQWGIISKSIGAKSKENTYLIQTSSTFSKYHNQRFIRGLEDTLKEINSSNPK